MTNLTFEEKVLSLSKSGYSLREITDFLNSTTFDVRGVLEFHGINAGNKPSTIFKDKEEFLKIKSLYEEGKTFTELSKLLGCSVAGLYEVLLVNNVVSRGNKDITGKDYNKRHSCNDSFFEVIDSEKKAYWLGYLFADGYNSTDKNMVSFSQSEPQEEMVYKFKEDLEATQPVSICGSRTNTIRGKEITSKPAHKITINSKQLSGDLAKHGCTQGKTFTITFPNIDDQFKSHFIRGYFDGDGSVTNVKDTTGTKAQFNIIGTLGLLLGIQKELVDKAGLNEIKISRARKDSNVYQLVYGGIENVKKFYSYLYLDSELYLPKKKAIFESVIKLYKDRDDNKDSLKKEKLEEIINLYVDGNSFRSIEKLTNVSRNTFSKFITQDIKDKALQKRNNKIIALYKEGNSLRKIEDILHISRAKISLIIINTTKKYQNECNIF